MAAYFNEIDPYAAQWLRNLIAAGHIAPGDVDERSIVDVHPDDLKGYAQCHFFAGIGGWSYAARLAGWPDDRALWTGSCPCQPFSVAGKGEGAKDERHLWPAFFALIRSCRPDVVMGEQVAAAVGKDWLDGVSADLEGIGYACGATVVSACAVDAPHRRDRLWFVADSQRQWLRSEGPGSAAAAARGVQGEASEWQRVRSDAGPNGVHRRGDVADANEPRQQGRVVLRERGGERSAWSRGVEWAIGADGKARRVEPGIRLLAHGVPARVGKLRAYGNAIVPQVAAEIIGAYLDVQEAA